MTQKERTCDGLNCEAKVRIKHLARIRGKYYCKNCAKEIRLRHREKLIQEEGLAKDLNEYNRQSKKAYNQEHKRKLSSKEKTQMFSPIFSKIAASPMIKQSKTKKTKKKKLHCSMSSVESTVLYHKHINEGLSPREAGECIHVIKDQLEETIKILNASIEDGLISYEEAKQKKIEFLEGLSYK